MKNYKNSRHHAPTALDNHRCIFRAEHEPIGQPRVREYATLGFEI